MRARVSTYTDFIFIYGIIRRKKRIEMPKIKCDPKKVVLAQAILETYNPESVEDMNNALKLDWLH